MPFLSRHRHKLAAIATLTIIFSIYLITLLPDILPGDSGEFQALIPAGGVLHPSGYPLYQILGKAEVFLLPVGTIAWRVTLLSAIFATAAAGVAMLLLRECSLTPLFAILGGGILALTPMLWRQAIIAEVYTLAVLLLMLIWLAGCRLYHGKGGLLLLAFLSGLALSHHLILAATLPWPFVALWRRREEISLQRTLIAFFLFLAPFSLYSLTIYNARKWMAVFPGKTFGYPDAIVRGYISPFWLAGFRGYITGGGYTNSSSALWRLQIHDWIPVIHLVSKWIFTNFGLLGIVLTMIGVWQLYHRQRFMLTMTLPSFLVVALFSGRYNIVFHEETGFFSVALVIVSVWIIFGVKTLSDILTNKKRVFSILLVLFLLLMEILAFGQNPVYWPEMHTSDLTPREWAATSLAEAEPDSIIFGDWGYITPLRYMQFVEHLREDVMVVHAPLGDDAFMTDLLAQTSQMGKKAYLLQPKPDSGPTLVSADSDAE